MNLDIKALTKDCPREDCSIVYGGTSSTLLGFTQTFDKQGNPQHSDPNTSTSHFACMKCRKGWQIKSRAGQPDQIETHDPTKVPAQ